MKRKIILSLLFGMIFLLGIISLVNALLTDNLQNYYKFDEQDMTGTGAIIDELGNNDLTNAGADNTTGVINTAYLYVKANTDWMESDGNVGITGNAARTFNFWVDDFVTGPTSEEWLLTYGSGGGGAKKWSLYSYDADGGVLRFSGSAADYSTNYTLDTNLHMITMTYDGTTLEIWIDTEQVLTQAVALATVDSHLFVGATLAGATPMDGKIDEMGIWTRELTHDEMVQLYNSGNGLSYDTFSQTEISSTLISPSDGSIFVTTNINFSVSLNITGSPSDLEWINTTYNLWFDNGTFFNSTTKSGLSGNETIETQEIENFPITDYIWNTYSCYGNVTFDNCTWSSSGNFSFDINAFQTDAESHLDSVVETSYQTFILNISTFEGYTISNGRLVYDGVIYPYATKTAIDSDSSMLIQRISVPVGDMGFKEENRSFYWNITIVDIDTGISSTDTTQTFYQNVTELKFQLCAGNTNVTLINFTLRDESDYSVINGSAHPVNYRATFNISAYSESKLKMYSISNLSTDDVSFAFCTNSNDSVIYADMASLYDAFGYSEREYYLSNSTLTNATSNIDLYLLNESSSVKFTIEVKEGVNLVKGAYVTISKYFVGDGVYQTTSIRQTDSNGRFVEYLELDRDYKFYVVVNGVLRKVLSERASCSSAPCELTLQIDGEQGDVWERYYQTYATNVLSNLSFDPTTKIVTYTFIDTTGLANYFRLQVDKTYLNESTQIICNTYFYTSSGSLTCNITGYSGDFVAKTYISRSPEKLDQVLSFLVGAIKEAWGIMAIFVSFAIILTITLAGAALSRGNPAVILFMFGISILATKLMTILPFSWGLVAVFELVIIVILAKLKT